MTKLYVAISAIIFALVAVGHGVRLFQGWPVQVGPKDIPMSISWIGLVVAAALALFVGYSGWKVPPGIARAGVRGLLALMTIVAVFTILLIVIGVATWLDYRREECELTNRYFKDGFRQPPRLSNLWRWYETYISILILVTTGVSWLLAETIVIPRIV